MNTPFSTLRLLWLGLCLGSLPLIAAEPAFRFEGGLVEGGVPANGTYDLTFALFAADTGGTTAGSHTNATVEVVGGVYEVLLPFAPALLDFNQQWIEVAARVSGSEDDRTVLTPRLFLSAVPYASKAALADGVVPGAIGALELQAGAVTSEAIQSGAVTLEKLDLTGAEEGQSIVRRGSAVNWESLNFWSLLGNAGTTPGVNFLGTTDGQPLEFRVNNQRGLLLIPTAAGANIIAGSGNNEIVPGQVVATISGGFGNSVAASGGTVAGGQGNAAGGQASTVSGGAGNAASGQRAVVSGGGSNVASGSGAAVVGGNQNRADGASAFVGGGQFQTAGGTFATVVGGLQNRATNSFAFLGGGSHNLIQQPYAVVGGGLSNVAATAASVIAGGEANLAAGVYSAVGGGRMNQTGGTDSVVGGGRENRASGTGAAVAGGWLNRAAGSYATIPGGIDNTASGFASFAAGQSATAGHDGAFVWADSSSGEFASTANDQFLIRAAGGVGIGTAEPQAALDVNGTLRAQGLQIPAGAAAGRVLSSDADGLASWQPQAVRLQPSAGNPNLIGGANNVISNQAMGTTISGGFSNHAGHDYATIAGGRDNRALGVGATVSGGRNNRVEGQSGTIAGGQQNVAAEFGSTIAGGQQNTASGFIATIGGGLGNIADGQLSVIGGGMANTSAGDRAFVGGGSINRALGDYAVATGGNRNWATGEYSTVGGGDNNIAGAEHSTVGGGLFNTAAGPYSSVPGGISNFALGEASQAAGQFAVAAHDGTFVWADASSIAEFATTAEHQFLIRAVGGVGIGLVDPETALDVNGTIRSRIGGIEFPDGSVQETAAFNGWSFSDGVLQVTPAQPFAISLGDQNAFRLEPNAVAANFIAGSAENTVGNGVVAATVGGGWLNAVNASSGTVSGGQGNRAEGVASTIGGGGGNRASGNRSVISGGNENVATGAFAAVGGGQLNSVTGTGVGGFIGGGFGNSISGADAVVGGGRRNLASGLNAFAGGGLSNRASGRFSVVAGGLSNQAAGTRSVVGGGEGNFADGSESTVSGGWLNEAAGQYAVVPGGVFNSALGLASFAAGQSAQANHHGSFVWSDLSSGELATTGPNQFLIRAAGGVGVGVDDPETALDVNGTIRSRIGGIEFPDGSVQETAAFDGWSFSDGVLQVTPAQPFAISLGDQNAFRLEPNAVAANFIAGSAENTVGNGVVAATVGGGWLNAVNASSGTVSGGQGNTAGGNGSAVGGGAANRADGLRAVIAGGNQNSALATASAVVGGQFNNITNSGGGSFLGGGFGNLVAAGDAVLAGGRRNTVGGANAFLGGGLSNVASGEFAAIVGGRLNRAAGADSTVQGGISNVTTGASSTVGGGSENIAAGQNSSVAGGEGNTATGRQSAIGGGWRNEAQGQFSVIPGGVFNRAFGLATLAAGQSAKAIHDGAFVWSDLSSGDFVSTGLNQFLIRAAGGVGVGVNDPQFALDVAGTIRSRDGGIQFPDGTLQTTAVSMAGWAVSNGVFQVAGTTSFAVALGEQVGLRLEPNAVAANFIAGSPQNFVAAGRVGAAIGGGWLNTVEASMGTVGGGQGNTVDGLAGTVGGGAGNHAAGNRAVIAGGNENLAAGQASALVGGQFNVIANGGSGGFLGGGFGNFVSAGDATLAGGRHNAVSGVNGFIGGGLSNVASGEFSVVAGGRLNSAAGPHAAVSGGLQNRATERYSNVAGGEENTATGRQSAVGGGWRNEAKGQYATVPGGVLNTASGLASLAAGQSAKAIHNGAFVWADVNGGDLTSTGANQFLIRAAGGVGIGTASPQAALDVVGEVRSTIFTPTSDRHAKENFAPIDPRAVLAKVAALPITRWNFKEFPGAEHFGPMAQDFHAAFGLNGGDDRHIATVDADGVALAAIQGLNLRLDEKSAEVETLKQQNSELLRRLEALEQKLK